VTGLLKSKLILGIKKILVLVHDAGGAELLSALIHEYQDSYVWRVVTTANSPAHLIFIKGGLERFLNLYDPGQIAPGYFDSFSYDIVFFNPGWNAFPREILPKLNLGRRKSAAFLEHWLDYRERFGYPEDGWRSALPDFTVVCDSKAYELASNYDFQNVVKLKNYHLCNQRKQFEALTKQMEDESDTLLFLSQTVDDAEMCRQYDGNFTYIGHYEREAITGIVDNFEALTDCLGVHNLKIRLHPSKTEFGHQDVLQRIDVVKLEVERAQDKNLLESIAGARVVVGMNSMALFTSHLCGKPAISFIPNESVKCTLPLQPEFCVHDISDILHISWDVLNSGSRGIDLFPERNLEGLFKEIQE